MGKPFSFIDLTTAINNLKSGNPVAIPTETVYGLAAPINNKTAINKIFSLKKRPFFDPLIVHISNKNDLPLLTDYSSPLLDKITEIFWPGPLTVVVPKKSNINPIITSGLDTVGVRCPNHPLTLRLIQELKIPLAAPSANIFGETSPTSILHVRNTWKESEVYALDGGECEVGIESTVLKLYKDSDSTKESIKILRKGHITSHVLKEKLGEEVTVHYAASQESPGHTPQHYMPKKPLVIITDPGTTSLSKNILTEITEKLQISKDPDASCYLELTLAKEPISAARTLYAKMHSLSKENIDFIIVKKNSLSKQSIVEQSYWEAIWDRLSRAATLDLSKEK